MKIVFSNKGTFAAMSAAEDWCEARGLAVGSSERGRPRGIRFGLWSIAKWRNLNLAEKQALHGTMTGDMRNGPVTVTLDERAVQAAGGSLSEAPELVSKEAP
jgi:hypothetical protein